MTLTISLGPPIVLFYLGYENRHKILMIASVFLFILNVYAIYKAYQNSKSVFVFCNLDTASKKNSIVKLAKEKKFRLISSLDDELIKLEYQRYALSVYYEVHFQIHENQIEFNAFSSDEPGVIDFGARKRILKLVKKKIEANCACV